MAFMMEKILSNAQKLSGRLKEHNGSTDNLVELMTALNKKIDSMKTFQDNLPDLTEMALRKPRCTIKLGLSQENSQIRELEQENKELKQSLEEHELALELIMSKYRQQVSKLLKSNQVNKSILYKEMVQSQDLQDKAEKIYEMGKMMWKAVGEDGHSTYDNQQLLTQLRLENSGMKEMLSIACNSGNSLKAYCQQTQTDAVTTSQSAALNLSSDSGVGVAAAESSGIPSGTMLRNSMHDSPNSETIRRPDVNSPREVRNLKAVSDLPCAGFISQKPDMPAASGIDRLSFSETCHKQPSSSDVVLRDVVTSKSRSMEQNAKEPRTINPKTSSPVASATVENKAVENQIPNHSECFLSGDDGNPPPVSADAHPASGTRNNPNADNTVQTSSEMNTAVPSPKQHTADDLLVNKTPIQPKGLTGNKNPAPVISSGGRASPRNPSSPGHGMAQKNVSTPSPSKLKVGNTASGSQLSKTPPGKSLAINDNASIVTGGKNLPSGSPSIHSGKTATAGHVARSTPIRIKATAKHPSVFSVIGSSSAASPQSGIDSSPATSVTSLAVLDSNGNAHHSPAPNEISNMNKASSDVTIDGQ